MEAVRSWILQSPHAALLPKDLAKIPQEWSIQKGNDTIQTLSVSVGTDSSVAVRWKKLDGNLEWHTEIVYSRQSADAWVGIRISRESNQPATRLPPARKPVIVRELMRCLGGAADGELAVSEDPHHLADDQMALAARLLAGHAGCRLPVVYVSRGFGGDYIVDASALASDLSGMAHVVVEPSRAFSRLLQTAVSSENVYGGTVGVYWPDGSGRRSFFIGHEFDSPLDVKWAVVNEVRSALVNRRPLPRCTWPAVQEVASKEAFASLKASGSNEVEKYIEIFDSEIAAKKHQLTEAEGEIARLNDEIRKLESQTAAGTVILRTGDEHDLYEGEMANIVRDALEDASKRALSDSRREHVLRAIMNSMASTKAASKQKETLKELLRDYKSMTGRTKRDLEDLGFEIADDGKHHKLVYQGDDRYTFSLSKSGSDHRGGLNAASDISKRLF